MNTSELDYNSNSLEDVNRWVNELNEEWNKANKKYWHSRHKQMLLDKYKQLHRTWCYKYIYPIAFVMFILMFVSFVLLIIAGCGKSFGVVFTRLSFATMLFSGIVVYTLSKIDDYIPEKIRVSDKKCELTDWEFIHLASLGTNLLVFQNREKYLIMSDKYENAYKVLGKIAKERDCTVNDLYSQYAKNGKN